MSSDLFPPLNPPKIYAYADNRYPGCLKVGYTSKSVQERVAAQYPVLLPEQSYKIELDDFATREDGSFFTDHDVHEVLRRRQVKRVQGEWFECDLEAVKSAVYEVKTGKRTEGKRILDFAMRPEQVAAVEKAIGYFKSFKAENTGAPPHFLWNAKMRFGKTFAAYQLAKKMGWSKLLILTFKPAVQNAWEEDLATHVDFAGWQFIARDGLQFEQASSIKPIVCFGSFQDYLGRNSAGGIKARNEWVHSTNWDCVIFDEYHYGAWRDNAKELFGVDTDASEELRQSERIEKEGVLEENRADYLEQNIPISTHAYLYLSGTPFRAMQSGELSKSRYLTGRIRTSNALKKTGPAIIIPMPLCRAW